jgi:hypothetical protein
VLLTPWESVEPRGGPASGAAMSERELIRSIVRGDTDLTELEKIGVVFEGEPPLMALLTRGHVPMVRVELSDLAYGLLATWAKGADFAKWATVLLEADFIHFANEDSLSWETLVEALRAASSVGSVPDEALDLARTMAL